MTRQLCLLAVFIAMRGDAGNGDATGLLGNELQSAPRTAVDSTLNPPPSLAPIWDSDLGNGFRGGTHDAGFALGNGFGMRVFSSSQKHDIALASVHYGWVFSDVAGRDHWYRGNWELIGEAFGGVQYHPDNAYVAGLTPILRYNFATGTRWMPFIDGGGGLSLTAIHAPDLGSTFEFNLQAGAGVHYFWRSNSAITVQYRYLHLSNADLRTPNLGVNTSVIYAGMSWFF